MASLGQLTPVAWHFLLSPPPGPLSSRWGAGKEVRVGVHLPISLAGRLCLVSGKRE